MATGQSENWWAQRRVEEDDRQRRLIRDQRDDDIARAIERDQPPGLYYPLQFLYHFAQPLWAVRMRMTDADIADLPADQLRYFVADSGYMTSLVPAVKVREYLHLGHPPGVTDVDVEFGRFDLWPHLADTDSDDLLTELQSAGMQHPGADLQCYPAAFPPTHSQPGDQQHLPRRGAGGRPPKNFWHDLAVKAIWIAYKDGIQGNPDRFAARILEEFADRDDGPGLTTVKKIASAVFKLEEADNN